MQFCIFFITLEETRGLHIVEQQNPNIPIEPIETTRHYEKYQIENIDDNDIDAIISRMKFVQYREESSWQMDVLSLF